MLHRKFWLADELKEDVLLAEIPSRGSCDELGLSDNEVEGISISSITTENPIIIDENTEVILEDDPILSQVSGQLRSPSSPSIIKTPSREATRTSFINKAGPSTSSDFQSPGLFELFSNQSPISENIQPQAQETVEHNTIISDNLDADDELDGLPLICRSH
ncbi:hypothetical protein J6590_101744 [Homalodisca vitripennis]|nr:hypothetical protein J6590_101744 [Homalodisca vitripennis]